MEHVFLHFSMDALKENPGPLVVLAIGIIGMILLIVKAYDDSDKRAAYGWLAAGAAALTLIIAVPWAESEMKSYCKSARGTASWDENACKYFDPLGDVSQ